MNSHTTPPDQDKGPVFYFNVVFWGEEFRNYFLEFLAPSLLSEHNIPALSNREESRFLIVTTQEDWQVIQDHPTYRLLARTITPIFHEMTHPTPEDNKYLVMSAAHRWASELTFENKAFGVFVTPDLVLSDGSVRALETHARAGKNIVLCGAVRFTTEGCLPEIRSLYNPQPGQPLTLDARGLTGIALRNLHPETKRYEYEAPWLADMPWTLFWRVSDGSGILVHTCSWAPLLVNYACLDEHDTSTFKEWTLDGDYIYRNFGHDRQMHVVTDSDEIMILSFTPEAELPNVPFDPMHPHWEKYLRLPLFGTYMRKMLVRMLFHESTLDPLKHALWPVPVKFHSGPLSDHWERTIRRAAPVMKDAETPPTDLMRHLKTSLVVPPDFNREAAFWQKWAQDKAVRILGSRAGGALARKLSGERARVGVRKAARLGFMALDALAKLALKLRG